MGAPTELVLYSGQLKERFDVEAGVRNLTNYLKSAVADMKHVVMALGKTPPLSSIGAIWWH